MSNLHTLRPFTIRPVILTASVEKRATFFTATCNYLYLIRAQAGEDVHGATPDFSDRNDLAVLGRAAPLRANCEAYHGQRLWQAADRNALDNRANEPVAWHAVGSLPIGLHMSDWRQIIDAFLEDRFARQGMIVDWAIHSRAETAEQAGVLPHIHMLITARAWDQKRNPGMVMPTWIRSHNSRRGHADAWYQATEMYPAPGFELRAPAA